MFNSTKLKKFTSMLCASLMIGTSSCFYKDRAGAQVIYYDENDQEITNSKDYCKASKVDFDSPICILLVYDGKNTKKDTLRPITEKTYWQQHARIKSDSLDNLDVVSMTCKELTEEITVSTKKITDELLEAEYEYPNQKKLYNAYETEIYHFAVVTDEKSYDEVGTTLYRSYAKTGTAPSPYAGILLLKPDYSFVSEYARLWLNYTVRWPAIRPINKKTTFFASQAYPIRLVGNPFLFQNCCRRSESHPRGRGDFVVDLLLSQKFSSKEKLHKQNTKIRLRKN